MKATILQGVPAHFRTKNALLRHGCGSWYQDLPWLGGLATLAGIQVGHDPPSMVLRSQGHELVGAEGGSRGRGFVPRRVTFGCHLGSEKTKRGEER